MTVSLHRLRKLLGHPGAIQLSERTISIDRKQCWVDAWAFEQRSVEDLAGTPADKDKTAAAWELYKGIFLPDDLDSSWTFSMRERLRGQFLRHVARTGKGHEDAGRLEDAALLYQKGIEADNLAEEFYQGLMRCHILQDRRAEAMAIYRRLRQTLSVTLGIKPSPHSEQLFRSIQHG